MATLSFMFLFRKQSSGLQQKDWATLTFRIIITDHSIENHKIEALGHDGDKLWIKNYVLSNNEWF